MYNCEQYRSEKVVRHYKIFPKYEEVYPECSTAHRYRKFRKWFGFIFEQKVLKISDSIKTCLADESNVIARNTPCSGVQHKLTQFSSLSESDVQRMVMKSNKKSCSLDPVPTNLMVDCIDILLPILTKLINFSLVTGQFHSHWKLAIVRPLLKKPGDDLQFTNFRPVSNLQYVSKLVEVAVLSWLKFRSRCCKHS